MDTLLVPVDGSPLSLTALRPAYALAGRTGAGVVLMAVEGAHDEPGDLRAIVDAAAEQLEPIAPTTVEVHAAGDPARSVATRVGELDDALLCLATHGRSGLGEALLGGVARDLVHDVSVPVLLVGPRCGPTVLPGERTEVLVCTDGSEFANRVLPVAAALADAADLGRRVVTVASPEEAVGNGEPPPDLATGRAQGLLDACCPELGGRGPAPVATEVLYGADPADSIVACARRTRPACIAIASHARRGLPGVALGSVAARVVHQAPCPVLVAPKHL